MPSSDDLSVASLTVRGASAGLKLHDSAVASGYALIQSSKATSDNEFALATNGVSLVLGAEHDVSILQADITASVAAPVVSLGSVAGAVSVYGVTPVAQAVAITTPTTVAAVTATAIAVTPANAAYNQTDQTALADEVIALRLDVIALRAEAAAAKVAIDALRVAVKNFGITA